MRRSIVLVAAALFTAAAGPLQAQGLRVAPRALLGLSGTLGRPVGEFQQFVGWGGGLDLYGLIPLPGSSAMGLRVEGSLLLYGHESYRAPFSTILKSRLVASSGSGPNRSSISDLKSASCDNSPIFAKRRYADIR